MQKLPGIFLMIVLLFICCITHAQTKTDSVAIKSGKVPGDTSKLADSTRKKVKKFDPRIATRRSALLAGWGQIYNKKYWKLPLIYAGLGITTGVFLYNLKTYKQLRIAYIYKTDSIPGNDALIDPRFVAFSPEAIRTNRDLFRQNIDYSVVFFILFWGLNIVDATVDAHLKEFDVNDNLSLRIKQGYSPLANTTGISLVLDIHSRKFKAGK
jgi:hypothetical protein